MTPREVFLALVHGVADERWDELPGLYAERTDVTHPFHPSRAPAMRTRAELAEHFRPGNADSRLRRRVTDVVVHETADPEVVVAEFAYAVSNTVTGEDFRVPGIFVLRVRDGLIVESRDYLDHLTSARSRGQEIS